MKADDFEGFDDDFDDNFDEEILQVTMSIFLL